MKKFYLLLVCLLISLSVFSQKETNNWIFGGGAWLDFNTEPPTEIMNNNIDFFTDQNSVSMSDEEGNLLFYSDGNSVFDKNHNIMPTGFLTGSAFGTHPVFAIPKPSSEHSYFLLTNSNGFANSFLEWREIDMTLNGGLGDVVQNIGEVLLNFSTHKITAAQHTNLNDIWVISHEANSNEYKAWLATENGIINTPVTSAIGSFIDSNNFDELNGQIKTSLDGSKIAAVNRGLNNIEIFDFNRSTGELSNLITISQFFSPTGVEFSPSGQFLYVSQDGESFEPEILQFDLWAGNANAIANSMVNIGSSIFVFGQSGALQLASNGKIYSINPFGFSIGIINQPNLSGLNCEYAPNGQLLNFSEIFLGLPSFYHKYLQTPYFTYSGFCPGGTTNFEINSFENTIDSVLWNFGDINSGANNFSTELNPSHDFIGTGAFQVTLTIYSDNQTFLNEGMVHIAPYGISLGPDQTVCSNQIFTLNANTANATYVWSDSSTTPSIEVTEPNTYWVEVSIDTCPLLTDTITINHLPAPDANLGGGGGLCNGDEVELDVTNPNSTYQWNTGATTPSIPVSFGGPYAVTVTSTNGCSDSDEVFYTFDQVIVNPSQANLACFEDSSGVALVFPIAGQLPFSYLWEDGDTLYTNNNLTAGDFEVTVTDAFGCSVIQEFNLTQPPKLETTFVVNADNPNTGNPDGQILLQPSGGNPPYTFDWENFGATDNPLKTDLSNGTYNITITDDNDCEEIIAVQVGIPTATDDFSLLEKIQVFPNPVNELLFLKIPESLNEVLEIEISNSLGQKMSENYFLEKGKTEFSINVNDWGSGIYFLKIKMETEERIWKVNIIK